MELKSLAYERAIVDPIFQHVKLGCDKAHKLGPNMLNAIMGEPSCATALVK